MNHITFSNLKPLGFKPSPQQQAVCKFVLYGRGHAFVEAVAGAGKSTLLRLICRIMSGEIVICAFNKKIAVEMQQKLMEEGLITDPKDWKARLKVGTVHSLGWGAWRRANKGCVINRHKMDDMIKALQVPEDLHSIVRKLVNHSRQSGILLLWQPGDRMKWYDIINHYSLDEDIIDPAQLDEAVDWAVRGITWYKKMGSTMVDFEDMVWLPAISPLFMGYKDWVLTDEAQDTNPTRRILIRKMLKRGGRAIFVGDRHQSIFGFTGADNDAVEQIVRDFECTLLPLTVTYRCPKRVVEFAQGYVSHIIAHESASEGEVIEVGAETFRKDLIPTLKHGDAILCRNTAPMVKLAFTLIRRLIPCHVEGRDIGESLIQLAKKYKTRNIDTWRNKLTKYRDTQMKKLKEQKKDSAAQSVEDRVDTLLVLAEGCNDIHEVIDRIVQLFKDAVNDDGTINEEVKNKVTLSTVHKAKGREWNDVFILGFRKYMPSKYARQDWEMEQETNIIYVAGTRAKQKLFLVEALE